MQHKYESAVNELKKVLAIDPEDLQANYNLMLSYRGLGQLEAAKEHEKRYLRFKADEAAQALTGKYRVEHPEDNNERQSIHEHESASLHSTASSQSQGANAKLRQHASPVATPTHAIT